MTQLVGIPNLLAPPNVGEEADARWNRWLAKGLRHDEVVGRRFKAAAGVIAVGLVTWMLLTI